MSVLSWADLPVTVFDRIFVDAITATRMAAVCTVWRRQILKIPRMKALIDARFQNLTGQDPEVFCRAISKNHKKLKLVANKTALNAISEQGLAINVDVRQLIPYLNEYLQQTTTNMLQKKPKSIEDLLLSIGYFGEATRVFKDTITGDVIVANDFYGGNEHFFFNNDMSMGVQKLEPFRILEKLLPGIFVWKVIRTHVRGYNSVQVGKCEYHRDTSIVLRFKTLGNKGLRGPKRDILTDAEISAIVTIRDSADRVVKKKKIERFPWFPLDARY
jgi:hypothetical protein